jgi:hypothetical protein
LFASTSVITFNGTKTQNFKEVPLLETALSDDPYAQSPGQSPVVTVFIELKQKTTDNFDIKLLQPPSPPAFTFGLPVGVKVDIFQHQNDQKKVLCVPKDYVFAMPPPPPPSPNANANEYADNAPNMQQNAASKPITIGGVQRIIQSRLGSGGIANVYTLKTNTSEEEDSEVVVKMYDKINDGLILSNALVCIQDVFEVVSNLAANTSFCDDASTDSFDIRNKDEQNSHIVCQDNNPIGYKMKKLSGSLDEFIMKRDKLKKSEEGNDTAFVSAVFNAADVLNSTYTAIGTDMFITRNFKSFVHGDIKLDNILFQESDNKAYIHDWDGVYVYDPDTLLHFKYQASSGYTRDMYSTPTSTHPLFYLYKHYATQKGTNTTKLITDITSNLHNFMLYWNFTMSAAFATNDIYKQKAIGMMMKVLPKDYIDAIKSLKTSSHDSSHITTWLKDQLAKLDLFSLGMSIIMKCFIMRDQADMGNITPLNDKEQVKLGKYTAMGLDIISDALVDPPGYKTMKVGGRKSRKMKGGIVGEMIDKRVIGTKPFTQYIVQTCIPTIFAKQNSKEQDRGMATVTPSSTPKTSILSKQTTKTITMGVSPIVRDPVVTSVEITDEEVYKALYEWLKHTPQSSTTSTTSTDDLNPKEILKYGTVVRHRYDPENELDYKGYVYIKTNDDTSVPEFVPHTNPYHM